MRFSERFGHKEVRTAIQIDGMDDRLRTGLWNVLDIKLISRFSNQLPPPERDFYVVLWDFLGWATDRVEWGNFRNVHELRGYFFTAPWYEVYDLIEHVVKVVPYPYAQISPPLTEIFNFVLQRENSGYQFIDQSLRPISSEEEVSAIEDALAMASPFAPVHTHLRTALDFLSDRESPNYRNSIKESISAVESLCALITGDPKATLGKALSHLEKSTSLHPALKKAFSSLYGYTSDAEGIRHALMEESTLRLEDAKFMLVSCSAFINYLLVKVAEGGIHLADNPEA